MDYKEYIKEVPNFPIDGVSFKDISPLLANPKVFRESIQEMGKLVGIKPTEPPYVTRYPDYWIAVDARGFIFASTIAYKLKNGLNDNEVILIPKNVKNKGFFEKFFQLFS